MTLRLYNTLTRTKEPFAPLDPKNVRMYVCGPTVYDYAHIGNARPAIVFDVLFRLLRHLYGAEHVTYVRNITDIDDKINARALEVRGPRNVDVLEVVRELTERTYGVYEDDVGALGCLTPTCRPRATEHVPQMIAMIRTLIDAGLAYEAEGHVLFDVAKKADYGKLSRRPLDEMIAGARVDVAPYKREAMDFVLWKPSDANTPGWDSPWGRGRPGWHLECSSMIEATMGETIDIHGGGIDLVFPHHENEIAQSEGAHHGHPLARVWMHNGFLNVEGEKMSKSLGNFVTIHELLETDRFGGRRWKGDVLRFGMLQTHYRQPIDWTVNLLEQSEARLNRWRVFAAERTGSKPNQKFFDAVLSDFADDLNTPKAFARIDEQISESDDPKDRYTVYKLIKFMGMKGPTSDALKMSKAATQIASYLTALSEDEWRSLIDNVGRKPLLTSGDPKSTTRLIASLGLLRSVLNNIAPRTKGLEKLSEVRAVQQQSIDTQLIDSMIEARNAARAAKNFKESDRIRDELLAQGIQLKDGPDGTTWEVKR